MADEHLGRSGLLATAAGYLALAVAATWPIVLDLTGSLSPGTDGPATVPYASAWALWWTAESLTHGLAGWWDAPIFHDERGVFAWSEAMPLPGLLAAPLRYVGLEPVAVYNVVLLGSLWLNGLAVLGLGRLLRLGVVASIAGGAIAVMLPVVHAELGVLTLVPLAPMVATLAAVIHLARGPTLGRGALLGVAVGATYLTCAQYGLFVVLGAGLAAPWLLRRELLARGPAAALLLGAVVAGLLVAPVAAHQRAAAHEAGLERTEERATKGSAHAAAWWRTPWRQAVPLPTVRQAESPGVRALFPGTLKFGLALLGVIWGMRRAERESEVAFLATFGLVALVLSMGPRLVPAYAVLREVVPGYAQIRSLWRFGFLAQVAVAILSAHGVQALWEAASRRRLRWGVAGLAALATVEMWPGPVVTIASPDPEDAAQALDWITREVSEDEPLAILPLPLASGSAGYEESAAWMVLQAEHGRPTVNGYSSYFPPDLKDLFAGAREGPTPSAVDLLAARGVCRVLVRSSWQDRSAVEARSEGALRWLEGWADEDLDGYAVTGRGCSRR